MDARKHNRGSVANRGGRGTVGNRGGRGTVGNRGGPGSSGPRGPYRPRLKVRKSAAVIKKVFYKSYTIPSLDLSLARRAASLHDWPDAWTVKHLMTSLEQGDGTLNFKTFHHHKANHGRLWSEWPTPLHVNCAFRACLLLPQREWWTDLDMVSAHNNICQYLAKTVGLTMCQLPEYLQSKADKHRHLLDLGIPKREVKQLWLSLLNMGTVSGWKRALRKQGLVGGVLQLPQVLQEHLKVFRTEVASVRAAILRIQPWTRVLEHTRARWAGKKSEAAILRSAWNTVLCTTESALIKELEAVIHQHSSSRVCMPSYDGLLLRHEVGGFDFDVVCQAWLRHCESKYSYSFPLAVKDWTKDVPVWMKTIMELESQILRAQTHAPAPSVASSSSKYTPVQLSHVKGVLRDAAPTGGGDTIVLNIDGINMRKQSKLHIMTDLLSKGFKANGYALAKTDDLGYVMQKAIR